MFIPGYRAEQRLPSTAAVLDGGVKAQKKLGDIKDHHNCLQDGKYKSGRSGLTAGQQLNFLINCLHSVQHFLH